jgi:hypothetical protein
MIKTKINLHEWTPLRPFRFTDEVHGGFLRRAIGLLRITNDARADDVFPGGGSAAIARDNVIQIQILPVKNFSAILAGILVPFENVVPCKLHFLFGQTVEYGEQNDPGNSDAERNGVNTFRMRLLLGEITPLIEIERLIGPLVIAQHDLGMTFKKKCKGATDSADVYCLPQAVQNQHMLIEERIHAVNAAEGNIQLITGQRLPHKCRVKSRCQTGFSDISAEVISQDRTFPLLKCKCLSASDITPTDRTSRARPAHVFAPLPTARPAFERFH